MSKPRDCPCGVDCFRADCTDTRCGIWADRTTEVDPSSLEQRLREWVNSLPAGTLGQVHIGTLMSVARGVSVDRTIYSGSLMDELAHRDAAGVTAVPESGPVAGPKFHLGDVVRKKSGSAWQGAVVGTYSTSLTPEGYAVESDAHSGSVQIYPAAALELVRAAGVRVPDRKTK